MEQMNQTYRGFVLSENESTYIVLSEREKKRYELTKVDGKIKTGILIMPDGHICNVEDIVFNDTKLFSALREYCYDINRKKQQYQRRKQKSELTEQERIWLNLQIAEANTKERLKWETRSNKKIRELFQLASVTPLD